jgi:micrococcal nuclease
MSTTRHLKPQPLVAIAILMVAVLTGFSGFAGFGNFPGLAGILRLAGVNSPGLRAEPGTVDLVVRVIDGDTILLERLGRVRLIGIDTPETVDPRRPVERFGKEASDFTRQLLAGKRVRVEYDGPRKDAYNRTLAYIFLLDGTFVNAEIVRQGYGFAYTRFPFKHLDEFRRYERDARDHHRGLWADESALKP